MMTFYPILIGLILISNYEIVDSLTCKNENGEPVDYWVAYKPPKRVDNNGYFYISNITNGWQHSTHSIESKESIVYRTFELFYVDKRYLSYAMFSDKKPQDTLSETLAGISSSNGLFGRKMRAKLTKFGTPKGVIAWQDANGQGFWVMSSISSFGPFSKTEYQWGETQSSPSSRDNGHLTMCLSLHADNTKRVLDHLMLMNVQVYDRKISDNDWFLQDAGDRVSKLYGHARDFEKKFSIYRKKQNSFGNVYDASSNKSLNFKSSQPKSKIRSFFERLKNIVFSNTIHDISEIQISDKKWSANEDESNWAVSRDGNVFCFSDLGYNAGFTDAGAMVCLKKPELHDAFFNSAIVKKI